MLLHIYNVIIYHTPHLILFNQFSIKYRFQFQILRILLYHLQALRKDWYLKKMP